MYSKKYIIEKIEEFNAHNPLYEDMEGNICYPAYFNIGERGWFLYIRKDWFEAPIPHRVHTSIVQNVEYVGDEIVLTTENTRFTFKIIK